MDQPLRITFHNLPASEAIEAEIRDQIARLERAYDRIVGARVVVDSPHRSGSRGKTYAVRVELKVPGPDIVVSREAEGELRFVLVDAFDAARRKLEELADRRRGDRGASRAQPEPGG